MAAFNTVVNPAKCGALADTKASSPAKCLVARAFLIEFQIERIWLMACLREIGTYELVRIEMAINREQRSDIDIYHGDPQSNLLRTIRDTMNHEGFRGMSNFGSLGDVRAALDRESPDVLVLGSEFRDGSVCSTIKELRHNETGRNPFVPVIITAWEPDRNLVEKIVDSGADALLVKPFSPWQLIERIDCLANRRKPFVVTSERIGPDRRKDTSRESEIPLIDVPNTLQAKAQGIAINASSLQQEIDDALTEVNEQKLLRHAFQVGFLVGVIVPTYDAGKFEAEVLDEIKLLVFVARDVERRMRGTQYEHVSGLCQTLIDLVTDMQENFPNASEKDVELLKQLSDAVLVGFHPDNDAAAMASEISASIKTFEAKRSRHTSVQHSVQAP